MTFASIHIVSMSATVIRRRRVARLHQQTGRRIARGDPAGDRARHDERRVGDAIGDDAVDVGVGLAEQAHRVTRRAQIALGGLLVRGRLLHVVLRHRACRVETAQAVQILAVEFQYAGSGDQGRLGLQQVGAVDGEQRLAFFHVVAHLGEQRDDPALIGREDLHRHVLIEVDAADRLLLDGKVALLDRCDLDRIELRIGQVHAVGTRTGRARRVGIARAAGWTSTPPGCQAK